MDEWARFMGLEYYAIRLAEVGRVVRCERFRTLMHFWLEFPDRCTRCRVDDVVGVDVFPSAVAMARLSAAERRRLLTNEWPE